MDIKENIVIVGGGIAATTCLQSLYQSFETWNVKNASIRIILISCKTSVKLTNNLKIVGRRMEKFNVIENDAKQLIQAAPANIKVDFIHGTVQRIHSDNSTLSYVCNQTYLPSTLSFTKLCLCTGASPKDLPIRQLIDDQQLWPYIVKIRDIDTLQNLENKLAKVKNLAIIGNGGIGLETVFKIPNCQKTWIIKDTSIGATFFDPGAAKFLIDTYHRKTNEKSTSMQQATNCRLISTDNVKNSVLDNNIEQDHQGCSLGPNWCQNINLNGNLSGRNQGNLLNVVYDDEVIGIELNDISGDSTLYPLRIITRKNVTFDCDLVILALGVAPNSSIVDKQQVSLDSRDNGIIVNTTMQTSVPNIYAAGDVISCSDWPDESLWFQMRLWTQARQMGFYAGKCIVAHLDNSDPSIHFNFDCFTHVTEFFDMKVVLLGNFKESGTSKKKEYDLLIRINSPDDYIKLVIDKKNGNIIGAVLIGNSELDETVENLIHDQIDVRPFKEQLLDNTVDIEDYFD